MTTSQKRKEVPVKKSRSKKRATGPARSDLESAGESDPRFVSDLLVRGEAAEKNAKGKLPLNATHIIEKKNADGTVQVKRLRFKAF
jgi:hypothetical protein